MTKYWGSCLCQKVTFEVVGEFNVFYLCHCSRCRKQTGSAHAANLFSKTAQFTWLSGRESVHTFRLSGTRFTKSFCTTCGSTLPTVGESGKVLVPAGSLDCTLDIKPNGHIFMGSKANWDQDFEKVAQFDGFPA